MSTLSVEAWLAGAAEEVSAAEFTRVVGLQVAVILRENQSPLRRRDGEVTATWFGEAVALRDPSRPEDGLHNRVVGVHPSTIGYVDDWVRHYEEIGIPCQIDLVPSCFTDEVRAALARRGFELAGVSRTYVADPRALAHRAHPGMRTEDVTPDTLGEVLDILAVGQGRPPVGPQLKRARALELARAPHYLVSLARIDGEPAAVASTCFEGRGAYLANAVTLPAKRRRGCQAALLAHRLREAAKRGCDLVVTDTLVGVESQRNVERAGLRGALGVGWWRRERGRDASH